MGRWKMNWTPVIWSVWGTSVVLMAIVILYASRLAKNEEDQLFLLNLQAMNNQSRRRLPLRSEIQPLKRLVLALVGATTLVVVVYYAFDVVHQLR